MKRLVLLLTTLSFLSTPVHAAERPLDITKAKKQEIHHSMVGFRSTLIFYTFAEQRVVMTVLIGNADTSFPVSTKVHLFDPATPAEGLAKWINNQHSDGLFVDPAQPKHITDLPKDACAVSAHKLTGTLQSPSPVRPGTYKKYEVTLTGKGHTEAGKFKLAPLSDKATVHVLVPKL